MKPLMRQLALAGLCLLSAGGALAAEVTVNYIEPGKFADMPFEPWERENVLKDLTEHFQKLGKQLPADQNLTIEVLDIDLAGRIYPNMRGQNLRVLRGGADWPRMRLRYRLEAGGQVLASGDAELSDMMYMQRNNRFSDGDTLRFEKQMIDDWFNKTFLPRR
ncbi:DUF3016 domain-containing protein [Massilia solisilvae]|uniref:DUF3016 domain-containing protein n=1 Tax=Massilia solisilvae TaxID=1811225 RepID=A0ABT2BRC6_9BURK|nr:DUF3016 domain-containing protein [Massilia solisilvae]MCS0611064.1 DUF3016 domain-containing protein [Massilia solisilvae]